jgi:hypothetical protein
LPDGTFSDQKCQFGYILEGLGMENVGVLHGHFVFLLLFWYILWQSGIFVAISVYIFSQFFFQQEKSGNLGTDLYNRL